MAGDAPLGQVPEKARASAGSGRPWPTRRRFAGRTRSGTSFRHAARWTSSALRPPICQPRNPSVRQRTKSWSLSLDEFEVRVLWESGTHVELEVVAPGKVEQGRIRGIGSVRPQRVQPPAFHQGAVESRFR